VQSLQGTDIKKNEETTAKKKSEASIWNASFLKQAHKNKRSNQLEEVLLC
jgi:hypothetical protein